MCFLTPHPPSHSDGPPVSLWLGHATALTCHWQVIHFRGDASLPMRGRLYKEPIMNNSWYSKNLKPFAQELRKNRNMTPQERKLWYHFLRDLPFTVKRQKIIGGYIADFYISKANLVIELDGSQHYEEAGLEYDKERDAYMKSLGLTVLRYSNTDLSRNFEAVCDDIRTHLPSPHGEGGPPPCGGG